MPSNQRNKHDTFDVRKESDGEASVIHVFPEHIAQIIGQYLERNGVRLSSSFYLEMPGPNGLWLYFGANSRHEPITSSLVRLEATKNE